MSDIKSTYSDYVRFRLKSENNTSLILNQEPEGWEDDNLELDRHESYYGIFIMFSNKLRFYGDAKDYILNAYEIGGVNAVVRLTKEVLRDFDGDVKWFERYSAIADFSTMTINGNALEIKFNSNDLAEIIKSHESDDFEIERVDSIDNYVFPDTPKIYNINLLGREMAGTAEQVLDLTDYEKNSAGEKYQRVNMGDTGYFGVRTQVTAQGPSYRWRPSTITLGTEYAESNPTDNSVDSAMFFIDDDVSGVTTEITVQWHFRAEFSAYAYFDTCNVYCDLVRYRKLDGVDGYEEVEVINLVSETGITYTPVRKVERFGIKTFTELDWNEGLVFRWSASSQRNDSGNKKVLGKFYEFEIKGQIKDFYEVSENVSFMFVHDLYERLLYILTGQKYKFYSKFFGRTELYNEKGYQLYEQDGTPEDENINTGLIGIISGYWVRKFDPQSEKYKSLTISLKDLIDSCMAVFNIGVGIETVDYKERLRIEDRKYFFRDKVVVKLPYQVTNVKRKIQPKIYNSGVELGYELGGDYENEVGLDEPNTRTSWVTPIRKSKNKYQQISKVRADEYGMEIIRRKPQLKFPDEDTSQDDHNWFLDLERDGFVPEVYRQAEYADRLEAGYVPINIHSPETFRSMIFTPLRMLFRHGWNIRSGMEVYYKKLIKYISSKKNSALKMQFPGESEYAENQDILISELDRSRYLEWEVEFEHPVNDELIDWIFGTTRELINGSYEDVPNFYYKFEWINEDEEVERGYLMNLKPTGNGKFKMLKANENLIRQ